MENERPQADIWYLGHSGFAVRTQAHFFIFDYYNDNPVSMTRCLDAGVVEPDELRNDDVTVFVSHRHPDHYSSKIFTWREKLPRVRYLLSADIRSAKQQADAVLKPGQDETVDGVRVRTLDSTDEGVAFLVQADGLTIYHAGDLNWWHWEGEPARDNEQMALKYQRETDKLKGIPIDLAFVPVDPRLEKQYLWGLTYLLKTTKVELAFPMHFWEDYNIFPRMRQDADLARWRTHIQPITRRGQHFTYPTQR